MDYTDVLVELDRLHIVDTHEHLPTEEGIIIRKPDFFDLLVPYVCDDLLCAGLELEKLKYMFDKKKDFEKRWKCLEPHLKNVQYTASFQAVRRVLNDIHGISEVSLENALRVSDNLKNRVKQGYYEQTFKMMNIKRANIFLEDYRLMQGYDPHLFELVPTVSQFTPTSVKDINIIEEYTGVEVRNLYTLKESIDSLFDIYRRYGIKAIKFGNSYQRRLDFIAPDTFKSEAVLKRVLTGHINLALNKKQLHQSYSDYYKLLPLDDYITWCMLGKCREMGIRAFFHTGIHAWNYNMVERCRATYLNNAIKAFSDVEFELLHCGYPYFDDALLLAKYYPNVYLNMTWLHIIDRVKTEEIICRLLETIPINKVSMFGGDYFFAENVYGHLTIAKENIAKVLYKKLIDKEMTETQIMHIARAWFE
ncbi:MAG: amidohydrolase family protein [Acetivibrionales bacterium]